ncbi:hypothetical protein MNBD_GAMMA04-1376 [hydrothermal vent metagenome]|uniref:Flagellar assembly protein T N-terminal domain-containing protein n=1 Tax=hydrothermal vent metagenome TaxID=652676 RepID=A0A3B0WCY2_9ZZZZ
MRRYWPLMGILLLFWASHTQAGLFDFFCLQGDVNCQEENRAQETQKARPASMQAVSEKSPCVDVKGSASMEGVDQAFARKMAIRDALKMASLKRNVTIRTDQSVEAYQLTLDSTRFTSNSKIKNYTITKEGLEDPEDLYGQNKEGALNYEVFLNVCLTEDAGICAGLEGNQYQARLAIAPIVMPFGSEARDISNLLPGYQLELERRLKNRGHQNLTLLLNPVDLQPNKTTTPNLDSKRLTDIRNQTGAQFLLLTVIRSLSAHSDSGVFNTAKRFYNLDVKPDRRYIEVDWYVVDLMKKTTRHQMRGKLDIEGDVLVGRTRPFGSNAFFDTETGKAFDALLAQQVKDVQGFMHCKPFESQVIDVQNGEYVIYLHESSGAKVGDDLAVYHTAGRSIKFAGVELGQDQVPGAFLKIKRIMPKFAIAELTAKKGIVQVGDIVKTW